MKSLYKTLNGIQTNLLTWGDPLDSNGKDVIIIITGNPGVPDFYTEFGTELHSSTGSPICVVGHTGHGEVPDANSNQLKNQENLFNLDGQLNHKLDLISLIDKQSKLHLIGHSIGAWMIIELLQKEPTVIDRLSSVNLLFPTIQKMAETKNGVFLNKFIRRIHTILLMWLTCIDFLPEFVKSFLVGCYLRFNSLPAHYTERTLKVIKCKVLEKVMFLAFDEMDRVREINGEVLGKIKHFTNVVYSVRDDWAPLSYMEDLKQYEPEMTLKEVNINHSFVLRSSEKVAGIVADLIKIQK